MKQTMFLLLAGLALAACSKAEFQSPVKTELPELKAEELIGKYLQNTGDQLVLTISEEDAADLGISASFYSKMTQEIEEVNHIIKEVKRQGGTAIYVSGKQTTKAQRSDEYLCATLGVQRGEENSRGMSGSNRMRAEFTVSASGAWSFTGQISSSPYVEETFCYYGYGNGSFEKTWYRNGAPAVTGDWQIGWVAKLFIPDTTRPTNTPTPPTIDAETEKFLDKVDPFRVTLREWMKSVNEMRPTEAESFITNSANVAAVFYAEKYIEP